MAKPQNIEELQARADEVARLLKTLSHPNRLLIACDLMDGERAVSEIEGRTGVKQPVLSRDLARLRTAGLVTPRRESKMIFYRLADDRLENLVTALCSAFAPERKPARASKRRPRKQPQKRKRAAWREI